MAKRGRKKDPNKKKPHTLKFYDSWWEMCVSGAMRFKISINRYIERAAVKQYQRDQKEMCADSERLSVNKEIL